MATAKAASKPRKKATKKKPAVKKLAVIEPASDIGIEVEPDTIQVPEQSPEQKQAKLNAYSMLKNAGADIPAELVTEVRAIVAAAKQEEENARKAAEKAQTEEEKQIVKENKDGPEYMRNTYNAPFAMRLERQDEKKKRIELAPRGQRGDMFPLQPGDREDSNVTLNVELGRIEIIGAGTAKSVLSKQTRNMGRVHTPLALLRNEKGEAYAEGSVKVEAEYNSQGVVVAYTDPSIGQQQENMKWSTGQKSAAGGLIRNTGQQQEQVAQFIPTGGNPAIISSGFPDANAQAKVADDLARRKGGQGPSSTGILSVTVDPVQKT